MSTTLAIAALLAVVLASISFLVGTTYTDRARDRAYRRLVEERRELNAMLWHAEGSYAVSPYRPPQLGTSRQTTWLRPTYDYDVDDD
ncbi:MAG: hypothetical protein DLM60_10675 [Pseudonocardiales bacterium]|nr:MAG: hypothetical protein DLM60_10675 [Pseudonocardiales bacterium]